MMSHVKAISVKKPEEGNVLCEDASLAQEGYVVVSDGAGGGGVFADRWAKYLVDNVPSTPLVTLDDFREWFDSIWESFYNEYEQVAQQEGGMLLNKFYDEGSFATLVAAWIADGDKVRWVAYGDSVVFHYDRTTQKLSHSFSALADFAQPPYLLNCKEEVNPDGFSTGEFDVKNPSYVFACSDALSHYVMMMYAVACGENISVLGDKNSNLVQLAKTKKLDFEKHVLKPLFNSLRDDRLDEHCRSLYRKGLLGLDDYSLARLI
ncbi:MAG: hypothetical protein J6R43_01450 [Paludibacteraceae bacterium]|nr:hypothetical protein [Paludibacteraceae bacterium]